MISRRRAREADFDTVTGSWQAVERGARRAENGGAIYRWLRCQKRALQARRGANGRERYPGAGDMHYAVMGRAEFCRRWTKRGGCTPHRPPLAEGEGGWLAQGGSGQGPRRKPPGASRSRWSRRHQGRRAEIVAQRPRLRKTARGRRSPNGREPTMCCCGVAGDCRGGKGGTRVPGGLALRVGTPTASRGAVCARREAAAPKLHFRAMASRFWLPTTILLWSRSVPGGSCRGQYFLQA